MSGVRILCFGDSLTSGYSAWGTISTPYGSNLKAWLEAAWPGRSITVDIAGVPGDYVMSPYGSFLSRIQTKCAQESVLYDWIIILGGTNDLAYGRDPAAIFGALLQVYQAGLDHGANVLALTVPEAYSDELSAETLKGLNDRRASLNKMIMDHKADRFYSLDLHDLLPNHQLSAEVRDEMWDDGIHLTPYGYGVMGDHIATHLVTIWPNVKDPRNARAADTASENV